MIYDEHLKVLRDCTKALEWAQYKDWRKKQGFMTFDEIIAKHAAAYKRVMEGACLISELSLYRDLYDFYVDAGEMPYGVQTCDTMEPDRWIEQRLEERAEKGGK